MAKVRILYDITSANNFNISIRFVRKYLIHIFVNIWRKSQCFLSFFKPYPSLAWTLSTTFFELLVCDNKFEFRTLHLLIHICLTKSVAGCLLYTFLTTCCPRHPFFWYLHESGVCTWRNWISNKSQSDLHEAGIF